MNRFLDPFDGPGDVNMKSGRAPLGKFKPYPNNPRFHPEAEIELLAKVIKLRGPDQPIVVDENFVILKGHGRLKAAELAGVKQFPFVQRFGLSETEKLAIRIEDNALPLMGSWNAGLLSALGQLRTDGYDMQMLGFSESELKLFLPAIPGNDPEATPEPPVEPVSRRGDLWILGKHRLICGDSRNAKDVASLMRGEFADLCFTSPPYAQQRDYDGAEAIVQDWDGLMQGVFQNAPMAPAGQILVNLGLVHRDGEWLPYWDGWIEWMRNRGWRRFGWYVWDKGVGKPGEWNGRLAPSHEFIFHFTQGSVQSAKKWIATKPDSKDKNRKGKPGFRAKDGVVRPMRSPEKAGQSWKVPDSVLRIPSEKSRGIHTKGHPAVFPVALPTFGLETWHGQSIYEPFSGSGTTIIAAEIAGRCCYAIELSPAYVDVAVQRWEQFANGKAVLEGDGRNFAEVGKARKGSGGAKKKKAAK